MNVLKPNITTRKDNITSMSSSGDSTTRYSFMYQRSSSVTDKKRSPQPPPRSKLKHQQTTASTYPANVSDSEGSQDSNSLSGESGVVENPKELIHITSSAASRKKANRRRGSEWEILEGLKDGQRFDAKPEKYTGYLHKKRKWPLKGWHKRYFVVDKGILVYAKNPSDIARGKLHGSVDIGLSVISTKEKRKRLDIDAEEFIYHLKAKSVEQFVIWVKQLKAHRLYRQHLLTYGTRELPLIRTQGTATLDEVDSPTVRTKLPLTPPEIHRDGSLPRGIKPLASSVVSPGGRLAAWIIDSGPVLESTNKDITQIQQNIAQLMRILDHIEVVPNLNSSAEVQQDLSVEGFSPNVKKDRKKFGLRKKKSSKGSSVDLTSNFSLNPDNASPLSTCSFAGTLSTSPQSIPNAQLSASNTSLATANTSGIASLPVSTSVARPHSLPGPEHLAPFTTSSGPSSIGTDRQLSGTPDHQLRDDYTILAKDIAGNLKSVLFTLITERDRLKTAIDSDLANPASQHSSLNSMVISLRNSLNQALQQNQELKNRLTKVHETSDLSDLSSVGPASEICRPFNASLSYSSSCVSASELFFDAEDTGHSNDEVLVVEMEDADQIEGGEENEVPAPLSDTSSEAGSLTSEEGSVSSENSEIGTEYNVGNSLTEGGVSTVQCMTGRRTKLPVPKPNTEGLSLWNLLCKNIGKDLSQISMPVALNEPLNMLQRLCEELEYSELLDKAAELNDPYERMVYVAAFAVSGYGSSYFRAGNKPFNPLLGETYECIREDKGFKFISEQVSHHPPVSVCYADSRNFIFWQDARIKTKFWGKSMEFQPIGMVNLQLPRTGEFYQWNKVTTCVHNLFSGQRWVDQYGELKITSNTNITCKLTFVKASYWSAKRHEIYGVITNEDGKVIRKLFGKWSEALYCGQAPSAKCIWRQGTMPEDYELYYGFTRFAIELNELGPEAPLLPTTDTRLRPDQRALERGDLDAAETLKLELEQSQRERRKKFELDGIQHEPKWFSRKILENGEESWEYNGKYWEVRKNPGFVNLTFEALW